MAKERKLTYPIVNCNCFPRLEMNVNGSAIKDNSGLNKYRQAGYGFLVLNLIYILLFYIFPPPFDPGLMGKILLTVVLIALAAVLSYFVRKGIKKLVIVLAVVYAARAVIISAYALVTGQVFESVPYVLACLILTFYALGRAAWDWP